MITYFLLPFIIITRKNVYIYFIMLLIWFYGFFYREIYLWGFLSAIKMQLCINVPS